MVSTKHKKIMFGRIAYAQQKQEPQPNTQKMRAERMEIIKILQKGKKENTFSGYKKVDYEEQKLQETYRKINKMLGGS